MSTDLSDSNELLALRKRIADLEKDLSDCDSQWQHAVSKAMQLEQENERLRAKLYAISAAYKYMSNESDNQELFEEIRNIENLPMTPWAIDAVRGEK